MNRPIIYTIDSANHLTAMTQAAPENEDTMQRLIADYPEIIADRDGALLLIRREQPITDREDGGARWSLDHLFVAREAVPVLVELKRAADTRLRREVVGQMLDYAANASAYWRAGTVAQSFVATAQEQGRDPDVILTEFLPDGTTADAFWQQVDANFTAGRMKLVFVADTIPRELARIVEFMNEQMRADVRAVELSWFEGSGVRAFTPRIIGETERAQTAKAAAAALPVRTRDEWIAEHLSAFGPQVIEAANHFVALIDEAGGHAEVTTAQGSIIAVFDLPGTTLYPVGLTRYGKGMVQLNLNYLKSCPAFASDEVREDLYRCVSDLVGTLSTKTLSGFPAFPAIKLNDASIRDGLAAILRDIVSRAT